MQNVTYNRRMHVQHAARSWLTCLTEAAPLIAAWNVLGSESSEFDIELDEQPSEHASHAAQYAVDR